MTTMKHLLTILTNQYPQLDVRPISEWTNKSSDGIWIRCNNATINSSPAFDMDIHINTFGIHPQLNQVIKSHNWFGEAYDGGTLLLYPNNC